MAAIALVRLLARRCSSRIRPSSAVTEFVGGAIAVQYFRLQEWVDSVTGLVALGGLIFGCGLPVWAIVRWVFNFIERNRDAGIDDVAEEVEEAL